MSSPNGITVANRLAAVRKQSSFSAAKLAQLTGVSRQTIYAMEAGDYVPNTAVALKLARVLSVSIEDLFSLPEDSTNFPNQPEKAILLPLTGSFGAGQPMQACEVGGKLVAASISPASFLPPHADAVVAGQNKIRFYKSKSEATPENRLLIAGCDPALTLLTRHLQAAGVELVLLHQNSSQALSLLRQGHIHVAGTHLRDESTGHCNVPEVKKLFAKDSVAIVSFALWQEGLVTAAGNPKNIRRIEDLSRQNISFLNREHGAGSRLLLDSHLKRLGMNASLIRGYEQSASGHLAAVSAVNSGVADCCLAASSAARAFGLNFIPLQTVRFDLVAPTRYLSLPAMQRFFETITIQKVRSNLSDIAGYETGVTGQRIL